MRLYRIRTQRPNRHARRLLYGMSFVGFTSFCVLLYFRNVVIHVVRFYQLPQSYFTGSGLTPVLLLLPAVVDTTAVFDSDASYYIQYLIQCTIQQPSTIKIRVDIDGATASVIGEVQRYVRKRLKRKESKEKGPSPFQMNAQHSTLNSHSTTWCAFVYLD